MRSLFFIIQSCNPKRDSKILEVVRTLVSFPGRLWQIICCSEVKLHSKVWVTHFPKRNKTGRLLFTADSRKGGGLNHSGCPLSWDYHQRTYDYCKSISAAVMWLPPDSAAAGQNKAEQLSFLCECVCVDLQDSGGVWVWAFAAIRAPRRIHNTTTTMAEEPRRADMLERPRGPQGRERHKEQK